jgi:hypothetical protein
MVSEPPIGYFLKECLNKTAALQNVRTFSFVTKAIMQIYNKMTNCCNVMI